ncbi:MAG TPA: NlpC/P60 family protein [Rubrobacteraceae bacterium]|nr:NlpC/P60 family protein [Rubrobacteraceae bacterium]
MGLALVVSFAAPEGSKAVSDGPAANPQAAQYRGEGSSDEPPRYDPLWSFEVPAPEVRLPERGREVSEGSAPGARAPAEAISEMEPARPYSQVVNDSSGRFKARGWKERFPRNARDFSFVEPARDAAPALYRVKIPAEGKYTVYARWPAAKGNNPTAHFGVDTPSGVRWTSVNQRRDGGMWMRIGEYRMERGDRYAVRLSGHSKAEGRVVADGVMVVRGTQATPPGADDTPLRTAGDPATGHDVVREARSHIGTPYRHSPPEPCQPHRSEDCSCLTSIVFDWVEMPDNPTEQWGYGREVARSELRPGDLVFFKEGESSIITHVAIYSGNGNIVHASSYWGRVVERELRHVDGYFGAKRLTG